MLRNMLKKRFIYFFIFAILFAFPVFVCAEGSQKINVVVTVPPLADLVERIAGDLADVVIMVEPGSNLHTYEPTVAQLKKISQADMYVALGSGVEFELVWMEKLMDLNRRMVVCYSANNEDLVGHDVHAGHEHDPHAWLSPHNVVSMIDEISAALSLLNPEHRDQYRANALNASSLFTTLDHQLQEFFYQRKNNAFMVVHPAWGHFAKRYGLKQIAVFHEGKEPSFKQLKKYIDEARENQISIIFASPFTNQKIAHVIAREIDGTIFPLDPLEKNLLKNFEYLKKVFEEN
ncbi:metal ABC transporter solute-binding protein, Zn/Mn family [Candidatus Omnitrophota bacterium]